MSILERLEESMIGASGSLLETLHFFEKRINQLEISTALQMETNKQLVDNNARLIETNARLIERIKRLERDVAVAQAACEEHELFRLKFANLATDTTRLQEGQSSMSQLENDVKSLKHKAERNEIQQQVDQESLYMLYHITRTDYTRLSTRIDDAIALNELVGENTEIDTRLLQNLRALQFDSSCRYTWRAPMHLVRGILAAGWTEHHTGGAKIWAHVLCRLFDIHARLGSWVRSKTQLQRSQMILCGRQLRPIGCLVQDLLSEIIQLYTTQTEEDHGAIGFGISEASMHSRLSAIENALTQLERDLTNHRRGEAPVERSADGNRIPHARTPNRLDKTNNGSNTANLEKQSEGQDSSQLVLEAYLATKDKDGMKPWPKGLPPLWEGADPREVRSDRN
ncbi:hypothetical protein IAU59_000324 [Kwoniella sp. CBS 9459]